MKAVAIAFLVFALLAAGGVFLWRNYFQVRWIRGKPLPVVVVPTQSAADWTPERMAKDPQGYLQWADQRAQEQIAQRQARLATMAQQRADIEARRQQFESNLADVQNIHDRMQRAYRAADDEDRWPLSMAGQTFSRERAKAVLDRTQKYLDERKSLAQSYDESVGRVDQVTALVKKDIDDLNTLRDHLAIDLEKVRLNNGMAELDQLHSTQAEVETTANSLAGLDHNANLTDLPPTPADHERIDIDSMLK